MSGKNDYSILLGLAINIQQAQNKLNAQIKQLKLEAPIEISSASAKKAIKELSAESQKLLSQNKNILDNKITTYLRENTKLSSGLKNEMLQIQNSIKDVDASGLKNLQKEFNVTRQHAKALGQEGRSLTTELKNNFGKVVNWISLTTVFFTVTRGLKNLVTTVIELNTAMIDLRKTTNATEKEYLQFYHSANKTAKQLGITTKEVISQTAEWTRLGYSIKEASNLAQNSAIFKAISPNMDISKATDGLVSILKAYKINPNDALDGIISKINAVGNAFAVSNLDIVEMMTRTSSAMAAANNTMEETIALGTAGIEITRDAEGMGAALRTISMRIRGMNEETEELDDNLANITGRIYDLTKVSIMSDPNTYKSTYQILKEISEVWDNLTDKTRAETLELLTGKRQAQIGSAILTNFDSANRSLEIMMDSQGNAMREMEIIYDSIEYKINQYKESMVGMYQTVSNTDFMKGVISSGTNFTTMITSIIEKIGVIPTLIGAITIAMNLMGKNNAFTKISGNVLHTTGNFEKLNNSITRYNALSTKTQSFQLRYNEMLAKSNTNMSKYLLSLNGANASMTGYIGHLVASKAATIALQTATLALNVALTMGISLAISAIVSSISKLVNAQKEAIQKARELSDAYKDTVTTVNSNIRTLEGLRSEFESLSKGVDENGKNVSLTAEQYDRYKSIIEQVVGISPQLVKGYDAEGNALVNNNGLLDEAIRLQKELNEQKKQEYLLSGRDILKGNRKESDQFTRELLGGLNNVRFKLFDFDWGNGSAYFKKGLENVFKDLNINIQDPSVNVSEKLIEISKLVTARELVIDRLKEQNVLSEQEIQYLDNEIQRLDIIRKNLDMVNQGTATYLSIWASSKDNQDWYNQLQTGFMDEFNKQLSTIASDTSLSIEGMQIETKKLATSFLEVQSSIPSKELNDLKGQLLDGSISTDEYNEKLRNHVLRIQNLADSYQATNPILAELLRMIAGSYVDFANSSDAIKDNTIAIKSYKEILDDVSSSAKLVGDAQKELSESGYLSYNTVSKLLDVYPKLESSLTLTAEGYKVTEGALQDLIDVQLKEYQLSLDNAVRSAESVYGAENLKQAGYDGSTESIKKLISAKIKLLQVEALEARQQYADLGIGGAGLKSYSPYTNVLAELTELERSLNNIGNAETNLANARKAIVQINNEVAKSSKSKSSKSNSSNTKTDNTDYHKKAFEKELKDLKYSLDMKKITEEKYYAELQKLNNRYFKNKKQYLDEYRQYEVEVFNGQLKLQQQAISDIEKLANIRVQMIKHEKNQAKEALKAVKDAEKQKLDATLKVIDARKEAIRLMKDEQDYQKELAEKTKSVTDIQAELRKLELDDSASATRRKLELQNELTKSLESLNELQTNHVIEKQMKELDAQAEKEQKAYDKKAESLDKQIDLIDDYLSKQGLLFQDALKDISGMNDSLYKSMISWNSVYGDGIKQNITSSWNDAYNALSRYSSALNAVSAYNSLQNAQVSNKVATTSTTPVKANTTSSTVKSSTSTASSNSSLANAFAKEKYQGNKSQLNVNNSVVDWLKYRDYASSTSARRTIYQALGGTGTYTGTASQNTWMLSKLKASGFKTGNNEVGDLIKSTGEHGFALVRKGESIFKPEHTRDIKDLLSALNPILPLIKNVAIPSIKGNNNQPIVVQEGDIHINGGATKEALDQIKRIKQDWINEMFRKMDFNKSRIGIKHSTNF